MIAILSLNFLFATFWYTCWAKSAVNASFPTLYRFADAGNLNYIVYSLQLRGNAVFLFPRPRDFFRACRKLSSFVISAQRVVLPPIDLFVFGSHLFESPYQKSTKIDYLLWVREIVLGTSAPIISCIPKMKKVFCVLLCNSAQINLVDRVVENTRHLGQCSLKSLPLFAKHGCGCLFGLVKQILKWKHLAVITKQNNSPMFTATYLHQ